MGSHPTGRLSFVELRSPTSDSVASGGPRNVPSDTNEKPPEGGFSFVELRGFEPLTPSLRTKCATNCATAPYDAQG